MDGLERVYYITMCLSSLTLLVLVAEPPGLVGPGGPGAAVDLGELAVLPAAHAQQVPQHVALLLAVQLRHVLVRSHGEALRRDVSLIQII